MGGSNFWGTKKEVDVSVDFTLHFQNMSPMKI